MLKKLTLKNFVHFPDEQTFEFAEGCSFFIGENRSGKSCAFEAVRRCMSSSKNVFLSSSHDKSKSSVVICEYSHIRAADARSSNIVSCYVRIPNINGDYASAVVVKLVVGESSERELFVDLLKKRQHGYPVNKAFLLDDDTKHQVLNELVREKFSTDSVETCIRRRIVGTEVFNRFQSGTQCGEYDSGTPCERFLKEKLDVKVIITDPMRSTCPVQWTNSKKLDRLTTGTEDVIFHNEMQDNSEILSWYLESIDVSDKEREKVDQYFDILTEGSELRFEKKDDIIEVMDNGNVVSLEKAPEGIFEAKICAILLSIDQFETVCLEEPGRGMHPQMIERFRDLIMKQIKGKTVIIISHTPTFLTCWNVERIFFFRRAVGADGRGTFTIVRGYELLSADETKTRRMITNQVLATIFFARRVLLVEGESELMFMSAVKTILLNNDELKRHMITKAGVNSTPEQFQRFLFSLHILPLNGEPNKLRLEKVCKALTLERYFILDYDAILEVNDGQGRQTTDQFFSKFQLTHLQAEFKRQGVSTLEKEGLFVWAIGPVQAKRKVGTIEDALISLTELQRGDLRTIFDNNNATLKWCHDTKMKSRHKLFSSRDLTEENIDTVVKAVIHCCIDYPKSDVFRLMNFLCNACC